MTSVSAAKAATSRPISTPNITPAVNAATMPSMGRTPRSEPGDGTGTFMPLVLVSAAGPAGERNDGPERETRSEGSESAERRCAADVEHTRVEAWALCREGVRRRPGEPNREHERRR